ncbi:Putative acyltransferase [Mycobacteroides abscessus subsp. abscessus]|nr:Putative acyltransferase [Mycobacteroides abscessus subsp. abscessus]
MEPVYGTVIGLARTVWAIQGLKFTVGAATDLKSMAANLVVPHR